MDHMGCMVGVRWGQGSQIYGPHGVSSQHDGGRKSQGVTGSCGGLFPPGLWVTCSHGVTHIQGDEVILGYGSCGVTAQGPTFGPQGRPVPSQDEMKPLQTLPTPPPFLPQTAPHILPYSLRPHTTPCPCSHLQPTSCFLLNSILLLQPVFPHPLMSLYPPNTPPESPIAPQGPSQTQYISPTDKLGHHRLLQSPAAAHIPL